MYILDVDKLEQFDILLVRFSDDNSREIREACNSNYSHAVVYLGNSSFIEGVAPTVSLFSDHRYYFPDLENVKILRLNSEAKAKFDGNIAEETLRRMAYCNYSKRLLYYINKRTISNEIIKNFFKNRVWQGGVVCTSLVTLPYYAGGIDISMKNEPYYAHFGDIEQFKAFQDVTENVFMEVQQDELRKDSFDYFTTYETGSLLEKQTEAVGKLNAYVQAKYRDILKNSDKYSDIEIIQENLGFSTWEDIYPNIMRWYLTETGRKIDEELSNLLVSTGYHLLWLEEIHKHKEQYFPIYYHPFTNFSKKDLLFLKHTLEGTYNRMRESQEAVDHNFTLCPCKTFHILLYMYKSFADTLETSMLQYDTLIEHLS